MKTRNTDRGAEEPRQQVFTNSDNNCPFNKFHCGVYHRPDLVAALSNLVTTVASKSELSQLLKENHIASKNGILTISGHYHVVPTLGALLLRLLL